MTIRWGTIRRWWARIGAVLLVVFLLWQILAFQTWGVEEETFQSSATVEVVDAPPFLRFTPRRPRAAGLIFFPGGLVDPLAYAPLLRRVAEAGYPAVLVKLPLRGFSTDIAARDAVGATRQILKEDPEVRWLVGGHSKGGLFACHVAAAQPIHGLLLVGTTHPREIDLSSLRIPVTKVLGTRDGVASPDRARAFASRLPASTRWVVLAGANHSQFGYYGFQFGDRFASIDRARQQDQLVAVVLADLAGLVDSL